MASAATPSTPSAFKRRNPNSQHFDLSAFKRENDLESPTYVRRDGRLVMISPKQDKQL